MKTFLFIVPKWIGAVMSLFLIVILVFLTILLILWGYDISWTGFQPKNLWDWMTLLIVPLALAIGGFLFNQSQNAQDNKKSEDESRETALQNYIDKVSELLLKHDLRVSNRDSEVR